MSEKRMRALVLVENGVLESRLVPMPDAGAARQVLIRVIAAGICGSDLPRAFEHGAYRYPLILGHEISGVVERVPERTVSEATVSEGNRFQPGDLVAVFPLLPCMQCEACSIGAYAQCSNYDYFGSRRDGGFAEFMSVPEGNLFRLPPHVDPVHAALTEPAAVALHAVGRLSIRTGGRAVVFGGGPVGLFAAWWLRIAGCADVFVVDIDPEKLALARELGFTAIDGRDGDPVAAIRADHGDGGGVDYAVEACGIPATYRQALAAVDNFGQVVLMGNIKTPLTLDPPEVSSILRREIRIAGTWNSSVVPRGKDEWTTVLSFLDRAFDVEPFISHRLSFNEAPSFLQRMYRHEVAHMRVVILP